MTTETDQTPAEIVAKFQKDWAEMKAVNDSRIEALEKGKPTAEFDGRIAELETKMTAHDELNAKLTKAEAEREKQKAELEKQIVELKDTNSKRIDDLTAALNRPTVPSDDPEAVTEEFKAYDAWLRKDKDRMAPDEIKVLEDIREKALTINDDSSLGYSAPREIVRQFERKLTVLSPLRSLVRQRNTSAKQVQISTRENNARASWITEVAERKKFTDSIGLGVVVIDVNELYAQTIITLQALEDSEFNVEREIRLDYLEQFAEAENEAFIRGTGVQQPEGILTNPDIESINSGSATGITFEGLISMIHSIKTGYDQRSYLLFNKSTLGAIRLLKDGAGQYIFQQGMAGTSGTPSSIAGQRYLEMPSMPNIAANATPVIYGDFNRLYVVVNRTSLVTTRDPFTRQSMGQVLFFGRRRVGGKVIQPEAAKKLTIAA